jgi:rSAM/selenodomain-associated transferase 1
MPASTTLIIFAREPIAGTTKTRLIARLGAANSAMLADAFTRDAIAKARGLGMPLVIAGSAPGGVRGSRYFRALARHAGTGLVDQGEGSLGARMARVIEPHAASGAILIGTDTPSLPTRVLRHNVALLRRSEVVFGPSLDGGYYLVGLRGSMRNIFRRIRWGGTRVLEQTLERVEQAGVRYALGPAWYDVDHWSDLMLLAEHLRRLGTRGTDRCPATARILMQLGLLRKAD